MLHNPRYSRLIPQPSLNGGDGRRPYTWLSDQIFRLTLVNHTNMFFFATFFRENRVVMMICVTARTGIKSPFMRQSL